MLMERRARVYQSWWEQIRRAASGQKRFLTEMPCLRQTPVSNNAKNDGLTLRDSMVTQLANRRHAALHFCKAGQRFLRLYRKFSSLRAFVASSQIGTHPNGLLCTPP